MTEQCSDEELTQPRPWGLLNVLDGGRTKRHFENRRGEGPGDEVGANVRNISKLVTAPNFP